MRTFVFCATLLAAVVLGVHCTGGNGGGNGAGQDGAPDGAQDAATCTPSCNGKCGGPDGCNGTCPLTCSIGQGCVGPAYTQCGACTPSCGGKCGGPDGCGGTCPNTCSNGQPCNAPDYIQCGCVSACTGKCGGPDGCGGKCPYTCGTGHICQPPDFTQCATAQACTSDATCGPPNLVCYKGYCDTGCTVANWCQGDWACNTATGWCKTNLPTPAAGDIYFISFGDTRPASNGAPYPTVTGTIFGHINALQPHLVVLGGDYIETSTNYYTDFLNLQHAHYTWSGPVYYALGNHEANSISTFKSVMAAGLIGGKAYYSIDDAGQNAKYVVISDDEWNATQKTWLQTELAKPTKYTFVFRHHPSSFTAGSSTHFESLPAVNPTSTVTTAQQEIVAMITAAKPTLVLVGHSHFYGMTKRAWVDAAGNAAEVILGNGGAPLASDTAGFPPNYYGFVLVQKLASGNIAVVSYESADENGNVKNPPVQVDWSVVVPY